MDRGGPQEFRLLFARYHCSYGTNNDNAQLFIRKFNMFVLHEHAEITNNSGLANSTDDAGLAPLAGIKSFTVNKMRTQCYLDTVESGVHCLRHPMKLSNA